MVSDYSVVPHIPQLSSCLLVTSPPPLQALLVIFWLVFTIMGMHIFGGLELQSIWPNYDTFFNSLISTFNVSRRPLLYLSQHQELEIVRVSGFRHLLRV